jgi:hypothetical protein
MIVSLSWLDFKNIILDKSRLRFVTKNGGDFDFYFLTYLDNCGAFESLIAKDSGSYQADFEENFKPYANVSNDVRDVRSITPKNEHTLLSEGMCKGYININGMVFDAILSDKTSVSGEASYSVSGCTPEVGDYFLQEGCSVRAEVEEIDGVTVTLSNENLSNGPAILSKPKKIDYVLTPIEGNSFQQDILGIGLPFTCLNLWGLFFDIENYSKNDFVELSIICTPGVDNPGDPGNWIVPPGTKIKDYDYSWVRTMVKQGLMLPPDGTPGIIPEGWAVRLSYFPTEVSAVDKFVDIWLDYIVTQKDS